ncbi:MAG: hypothetical protein CM15mP22_4920 [Gammaproteobacteria bacterium]|nr:MAG: hypothetical protein CM15mP22_4920 [Gammaproteobacteria bacterium]
MKKKSKIFLEKPPNILETIPFGKYEFNGDLKKKADEILKRR